MLFVMLTNKINNLLHFNHSLEIKKLISMSSILFLLFFCHCLLWNMKDTLVISASGAEIIPFIKVWAILPSAILLTFCFTYLSNYYSQEKIFYLMTSAFLGFFATFAFLIYPNRESLHPFESANLLEQLLPSGLKGFVSMYRFWTFTLFYVICELWHTMVITVLFWGFANQITRLSEAPRFYGALSFVSNAAVIAAAFTSLSASGHGVFNPLIPIGNTAWEQTMMLLVLLVLICGIAAMGVFRWLNKQLPKQQLALDQQTVKKDRLTFYESVLHVSRSTYLIGIAVVVVAYNLVINLVEVVWKDQLRSLYPDMFDYNTYISWVQASHGALALILSLCVARVIKRSGWTKTALVTPVAMMLSCLLFFSILFYQEGLKELFLSTIGIAPLTIAVFFGALQSSLSKSCKYSLFDSTKEMAYIPLSFESKLKGKAAIDGVGARLGKSGSSILHQGLLITFSTLTAGIPYIGALLLIAFGLWMGSIQHLSQAQKQKTLANRLF